MNINFDKLNHQNRESRIKELLLLIEFYKKYFMTDNLAKRNYIDCIDQLLELKYDKRLDFDLELPLNLMPVKYLETFNLSIPDNSHYVSNNFISTVKKYLKHIIFYSLYILFVVNFGLMLKNNAVITIVNSIYVAGIMLSGYAAYSITYNLILHEINLINRYLKENEDSKSFFFKIVSSINWVIKRLYKPSIDSLGKKIVVQSMAFILLALIGSYFIGISSIRILVNEDEFLRAILFPVLGILLISNRYVRE